MTRLNISMLAISLVLVASLVQQSSARSLHTIGQGSTCTASIPQCQERRCYLQPVSGKMQNVCERCTAGYIATENGLNCVCKSGFWHDCSSGNCQCKPCDRGMFCPGGWKRAKNYAADNLKGLRLSCEKAVEVTAASAITSETIQQKGLTTKSQRASRPQDCVPMPGFYLAATSRAAQTAALCLRSTYSLGYGRVRQCLRCQSGTEENPAAGYADDLVQLAPPNYDASRLRVNRLQVCQVPKGKYLVQNVVRDCPAGSFRTSYSLTTESASRYCFTCPPGVTTNGTAATSHEDCNVVMAGVQLSQDDLDAAQTLAASGHGLGDMAVNLCPYGTYFPGGVLTGNSTCVPCPFNTTTQAVGATSESDCQIPPGYYVKTSDSGATGVMEACPNNVTGQGYYRSGWTIHSDIKAQGPDGTTACTPCGAGILSALTDVDESLGGNDTTKLVAGSSYSCYIEGGWGMAPTGVILPDNTLQFSAVQCANNTYGVANTTYGLQSTPCKPCQRNLITLQAGSSDYTQCVNPAGYGYSPNGATACPCGSYAPAGSMQGCVQCPAGRTTAANATQQTAITDCYVSTGYGIFVGNDTNAWAPATSSMSPTEKAELPVLPCPVGYYGTGGQLDSKCDMCGPGTSTAGEGSISFSACNKCAAGWGRSSITTGRPRPSNCSICLAGTYQPGYLGNDGTGFGAGSTCITCATTRSVYISSQGNETEYVSEGTSYRNGAIRREECVPKTAQLGIDIGTKMFENATLLTADSAGPGNEDPESCMDTNCNSGQCCFVQFDYAYTKEQGLPGTKACLFVNMPANTNSTAHEKSTSNLLYYKMLPSDAIAAASLPKPAGTVEAKAMSSGLYARCDLPVSWAASGVYDTDQIGNRIGSAFAAGSAADLAECKRMCDMSSICWGFTVQNRLCQLRGGFDELDARSFFRNPDNPTGFNW